MIRPFVKISEQDLQIAEAFFENEKHFNEFLVNVFKYYRGRNIQIKTKIVQKYFNSYKKTMDFIIDAAKSGQEGGFKKAENQSLKDDTLQGGLENPISNPKDTHLPNKKVISNNYKAITEIEIKILTAILDFDYMAVLDLWLQHKKEKKQSYKETGLKVLAETIKKDYATVELFESAVKHSIAGNYAGIFAPKPQNNQTANTAAPKKMVY